MALSQDNRPINVYFVGDEVEVFWPEEQKWYRGTVVEMDRNDRIRVLYEDSDDVWHGSQSCEPENWRPVARSSFSSSTSEFSWALHGERVMFNGSDNVFND